MSAAELKFAAIESIDEVTLELYNEWNQYMIDIGAFDLVDFYTPCSRPLNEWQRTEFMKWNRAWKLDIEMEKKGLLLSKQYPTFKARLQSLKFHHSRSDYAYNGFHAHSYNGFNEICVKCAYCHAVIKAWRCGDEITQQHHRSHPDCPYVNCLI
jgi:hypothetical protein